MKSKETFDMNSCIQKCIWGAIKDKIIKMVLENNEKTNKNDAYNNININSSTSTENSSNKGFNYSFFQNTQMKQILLPDDYHFQLEMLIGRKYVDENELLIKEYYIWVDIFNNYKKKLPAFNKYVNTLSFKKLISEIKSSFEAIKEVVISSKIKGDDEIFKLKLRNQVKLYSNDYFSSSN